MVDMSQALFTFELISPSTQMESQPNSKLALVAAAWPCSNQAVLLEVYLTPENTVNTTEYQIQQYSVFQHLQYITYNWYHINYV